MKFDRRNFIQLAALGTGGLLLKGINAQGAFAEEGSVLLPTPPCEDPPATLRSGPGPFYRPNAPFRNNLADTDTDGSPFLLTGMVLTTACQPVPGAIIDLWHADEHGHYDMDGNHCRGKVRCDGEGKFRLETILPASYAGRTRHFHVKVEAQGKPTLTTQLYWPEEADNETDFLFKKALLMDVDSAQEHGRFHFVL